MLHHVARWHKGRSALIALSSRTGLTLLKRWLSGTLHYGYSVDQLDYHLDEFTFRFNRRSARSRGLLFYRLLQQAVAIDPIRTISSPATNVDRYLWA